MKNPFRREIWKGVLAVILLTLGFAGCQENNSPNLYFGKKTPDSVKTLSNTTVPKNINPDSKVVKSLGPNVKVVTGEPATTDTPSPPDVETAKDKPGAVAVKMEY